MLRDADPNNNISFGLDYSRDDIPDLSISVVKDVLADIESGARDDNVVWCPGMAACCC